MNVRLAFLTISALLIATPPVLAANSPNVPAKGKHLIAIQQAPKIGTGAPQPNAIGCDGSDDSVGCLVPDASPPENWAASMPFDLIGGGSIVANVELERVYVSGRAVCTLTIDGYPANLPGCDIQYLAPNQIPTFDQMTGTSKAGLGKKIIDWIFSKVPVNACLVSHPNPEKNRQVKNTTSLDTVELRGIAADSIIRATGVTYTSSGREFQVTYADGGSETIKFNYYGTTQVASNKDYVAGDGVSKCPVP